MLFSGGGMSGNVLLEGEAGSMPEPHKNVANKQLNCRKPPSFNIILLT